MSRPLKVYGWQTYACGVHQRAVATRRASHHTELRAIVAASSKTAAARIAGGTPRRLFNLGETWNAAETEAAMARPGVVLIAPLDLPRATPADYVPA